MAAVARGEDPEVSLLGLESPRSRYVSAERARVAEVRFATLCGSHACVGVWNGSSQLTRLPQTHTRAHTQGQRLAAVSAMQTESAKLLDSWGRHNVKTLTILETSASEFQNVTRALLDGMGETETADLEELLETIETCMGDVTRQRASLVEDAQGVADALHEFLGANGEGGKDESGEKPKSKLELRVEELEQVRGGCAVRCCAVLCTCLPVCLPACLPAGVALICPNGLCRCLRSESSLNLT
jgi:hypothetical protein